MKHLIHNNTQRGFTVVELLIVIVVIGLLTTVGVVSYNNVQKSAKDKAVLSDIDALSGIQANYQVTHSGTPKAWYSGNGLDPDLNFTPSNGTIIDVVVSGTDYCIRGYNPNSSKSTIATASIEESDPGVCLNLQPSIAAGGSGQSSLVGWWKFNGSGIDSSGNNITAVTGNAVLTTGENNEEKSAYDVSNNGLSIGAPSIFSTLTSTGFTYSIWVKRLAAPPSACTDSQSWPGGKWPLIMGRESHTYYAIRNFCYGNNFGFEYGTGTYAGTFTNTSTVNTAAIGDWHQITVTYTASVIRFYWDKVQIASTTATPLNPSNAGSFVFDTWTGANDDARVYKRALSPTEVQLLYDNGAQ